MVWTAGNYDVRTTRMPPRRRRYDLGLIKIWHVAIPRNCLSVFFIAYTVVTLSSDLNQKRHEKPLSRASFHQLGVTSFLRRLDMVNEW